MLFPRLTAVPSLSEPIDWPERFRQQAISCQNPLLKYYYQSGIPSSGTPLSEIEFLAIDFETTGLNPQRDAIISIGLVPFTLNRIRCREARHWLLKPDVPLKSASVIIHQITHADLDSAPDLTKILQPLLEALSGKIPVVHYQAIERPFLDQALKKRLGEGIHFPLVDTLSLEARVHRRKPMSLWSQILGKKPVSMRLADSRARYNLPFYTPHHALTDAIATAELLMAQMADRYSPDTPIAELWE